jgi:hypothetical protein
VLNLTKRSLDDQEVFGTKAGRETRKQETGAVIGLEDERAFDR